MQFLLPPEIASTDQIDIHLQVNVASNYVACSLHSNHFRGALFVFRCLTQRKLGRERRKQNGEMRKGERREREETTPSPLPHHHRHPQPQPLFSLIFDLVPNSAWSNGEKRTKNTTETRPQASNYGIQKFFRGHGDLFFSLHLLK